MAEPPAQAPTKAISLIDYLSQMPSKPIVFRHAIATRWVNSAINLTRGWRAVRCSLDGPAAGALGIASRCATVKTRFESFSKFSWRRPHLGECASPRTCVAIWRNANFNYWNAAERVLKSTLAEFTQGPVTTGDAVSATVTFDVEGKGSSVSIK